MPNRLPRRGALVLAVVAAALAGCGGAPTTKDFADKASSFIEGKIADAGQLNGLTFTGAVCDEPKSTKPGTEYSCTAMGSDGEQRTLTVKFVTRNTLQVTKVVPPAPAAPATTTPGSTPT